MFANKAIFCVYYLNQLLEICGYTFKVLFFHEQAIILATRIARVEAFVYSCKR